MKKKFSHIVFVAKNHSTESISLIIKMSTYLQSLGIATYIDESSVDADKKELLGNMPFISADRPDSNTHLDCCIAVGGDGTMMGAARSWGLMGVDLVGVNLGRVGYLTDIAASNCIEDLSHILNGKHKSQARSVLNIGVYEADKKMQDKVAINDFVCKSADGHLIEFTVLVDGEFVYSQYCDGIIVATPTGSTAYSVAAGGSIIQPKSKVWSIVPICPQNLSNRPLIVDDSSEIKIIYSSQGNFDCFCDGIKAQLIKNHSYFILSKHAHQFNLLNTENYNYYNGLRQKLNWNKN